MRACLACVLVLLGACVAFASPFDHVPKGDQAYADCAFLAERGIIDARPAGNFSDATLLTRYDFTMSLVRPIAALEGLAREGRAGGVLKATRSMAEGERARVGATLARLIQQFGDVLSLLGEDLSQALRGARLLASREYTASATARRADSSAGISYESARTRVGVVYRTATGEGASLPHIPLGGLDSAPIAGVTPHRAAGDDRTSDRIGTGEISLRGLQSTLEYGITDDLTLNLAYASLVREGRGTVLLDAASLRTLGIGYRLSSSAALKLSYHLIDYTDHTGTGARLVDRMAETELIVRF